jgi:hypothetical protein
LAALIVVVATLAIPETASSERGAPKFIGTTWLFTRASGQRIVDNAKWHLSFSRQRLGTAMPQYNELEITIRREEVRLKPLGAAESRGRPNFTDEVLGELKTLRAEDKPEAYGRKLFSATFADQNVAERYRNLIGRVVTGDARWRVRLNIPESETDLQELWWECLLDHRNRPLATGQKTPVSRFLGREEVGPPIEVDQVRILVVVANPKGLGRGNWGNFGRMKKPDQHVTTIQEAIREHDRVEILTLEDGERASVDNIRSKLLASDAKVNVLHLVAHGGKGVVLLEDAKGGVDDVDERRLAGLVSGVAGLQLVVLAACEGGKRSVGDTFVGLAPRMLSSEVPAIIAMQDMVSERAAATFAKWFYSSLVKSTAVEGRVDVAMTTARDQVALEKDVLWEWAIPVLFMRGEGRLFELKSDAEVGLAGSTAGGLPQETAVTPLLAAVSADESRQLFKLLVQMSKGQLVAVCWSVDVAFDDLPGDSHEERVISVVEECRSGSRLAELAEAIAVIQRGENKRAADEAKRQADQTDAIVLDITNRLAE